MITSRTAEVFRLNDNEVEVREPDGSWSQYRFQPDPTSRVGSVSQEMQRIESMLGEDLSWYAISGKFVFRKRCI